MTERRLAALCDDGDYEELFGHPGSVNVCARGMRGGRTFFLVASDPEPTAEAPDLAGSLKRILGTLAEAEAEGCPVVFLFDSPGVFRSGRTAFQGSDVELLMGPEGMGRWYRELARLVRKVPVVGAVFGTMAQAQAFPVAMCRAVVMTEEASLVMARPDAVKAMLGEETDYGALGGPEVHARFTGVCDHVAGGEAEALAWAGRILDLLPSNDALAPPAVPSCGVAVGAPLLEDVIPARPNQPYQGRRVVEALVDAGSFVELGEGYGREVVTGLARVEGRTCALAVSNPQVNGALLFADTCRKLVRFLELTDTFNVPLVFLADAPGFMFGSKAERQGIVAAGARVFEAIARTETPHLSVVLRRAYSAGLYAVGGAGLRPARFLALPGATISVYGAEAVERLLKKLELSKEEEADLRRRLDEEHSLERMRERGFLEDVVCPGAVRAAISEFLRESEPDS